MEYSALEGGYTFEGKEDAKELILSFIRFEFNNNNDRYFGWWYHTRGMKYKARRIENNPNIEMDLTNVFGAIGDGLTITSTVLWCFLFSGAWLWYIYIFKTIFFKSFFVTTLKFS